MRTCIWLLAVGHALILFSGCWSGSSQEVVVYTALDREFSQPILEDFEARAGIDVREKYDVESTKTVGLVNEIIQEGARPRCDLFWNNEILHTLRLKDLGLLEPYKLPQAEHFPADYRSTTGHWYGFAARARILVVNTERLPPEQWPTSVRDLVDPQWQGRVGIAKPLFGTTATHAAVLFAQWGPEEATQFFKDLKANVRVMSGNKQVATAVANGQLLFGLTDTDDAIVEKEKGLPVEIIYPDQQRDTDSDSQEQGMGTLFIPNTVAIIKGAPNPEGARRLMAALLTPEVERRLAEGASAQFPLHDQVDVQPRIYEEGIRKMKVDFQAAADAWDEASLILRDIFST